jgi:hypothetical protein
MVKSGACSHNGARQERSEIQRCVIKNFSSLLICRQENLKASVEQETFVPISSHTTSNGIGSLKYFKWNSLFLQPESARKSRKTGSDD